MAGCDQGDSGSKSAGGGRISLGYVKWEESEAVANLTKVILEDDLGYKKVKLKRGSPKKTIQGVADGDLVAFQDVWMPVHKKLLKGKGDKVGMLNTWLIGTTRASLAVPYYVKAKNISDLQKMGVEKILAVRPEAAAVGEVPQETNKRFGSNEVFFSNTTVMFDEMNRLYEAKKPFAFVAWSPHWINVKYDIDYLADPDKKLGDMTSPSEPVTIVSEGLSEKEPRVHRLLRILTLTNYQVSSLELDIRNSKTPKRGAKKWVDDHQGLVDDWVKKVKESDKKT